MTNPVASYTFLPWLRQGIAAQIAQADTLGTGGPAERASVQIALKVNDQDNFAANNVHLQGPGDVIGIQPQAVVRTEPRNWATDFEPNYLAAIDFYDEDFPWRYSPAAATQVNAAGGVVNDPGQTKLRPWIFLITLEEKEFTESGPLAGLLSTISLTGSPGGIFPPAAQAWAWAHVHVSSDITNAGANNPQQAAAALSSLVQANPDIALSRLVCPRKLREETAYHAFLIPAFEIGRLAGLGLPTAGKDALASSWGSGQVQYPIYYRWFFRTARRGDFEYLVNLIQPRPVDSRVGIRDMDMQAPGFDVPGMQNGPGESAVMGLEGALKSPQTNPRPAAWPPSHQPAFLKGLASMVNLQEDLLQAGGGSHPDPVISPPLYGRWHALQNRLQVGKPGWVNELNQDPRLRVPAGFGTQVIQANQESYMEKAWQQVGDVLAANQRIRQFQLSILTSANVFKHSFKPLDTDQKLALTAQVHSRVLSSSTTLAQQTKESRLPGAALKPAFRRITRPRGPLMRKVAAPGPAGQPANILTQMNAENGITAAPPKQAPDRAISLEKVTQTLGTPTTLAANAAPLIHLPVDPGSLIRTNRTVINIVSIPPRPGFVITEPGGSLPGGIGKNGSTDSSQGARFRQAFIDLNAHLEIPVPDNSIGPSLDFSQAVATLEQALNPARVIPQRALKLIAIPAGYQYLRPTETIAPVMAHPIIDDPMYKPLSDLSSELLIPNLNLISNNTITLLETNPRFIEAYMVGLNHEFARELLWREYPTDMRPSSFLLFWEPAEKASRDGRVDPAARASQMRDFKPLHEWGPQTPLGTHANKALPTGSEADATRLVLAVRGDLLKRYPTAIIYAQKAKWAADPQGPPGSLIRVLDESNPDQTILEPIFKAEVLPDLRFIGFNLTVSQAKGSARPADNDPGWFFVIQERPGEPRFGLEIEDTTTTLPAPTQWEDLAWNHLGDPNTIKFIDLSKAPVTNISAQPDNAIRWGANAADMAYILYRAPVMVAVHAESMLA